MPFFIDMSNGSKSTPYQDQKYRNRHDLLNVVDPNNIPKKLSFRLSDGSLIQMPYDVTIDVVGEKPLVESKILDGVNVIERIMRNPYQIFLQCTIREVKGQTSNNDWSTTGTQGADFIFPQDVIDNYWHRAFETDSVLKVENTMLNRMGITEVVVKYCNISTVRGSTNVPMRLDLIENIVNNKDFGTSLLI